MGLQVWLPTDVENILWATQTVMQATATASGGSGQSIGYDRGFKSAMQHITQSFEGRLSSQETWSREDVEKALQVIRAIALPATANSDDRGELLNYDQGFAQGLEVALWCIATSFGANLLSPESPPSATRTESAHPDTDSLWFSEDINNILLAVQEVVLATIAVLRGESQPADYNQGFEDALRCVATSFGVRLLTEGNCSLRKTNASPGGHFWLREDIQEKLLLICGTVQTARTVADQSGRSALYWQGFEAALRCIATSFGISV